MFEIGFGCHYQFKKQKDIHNQSREISRDIYCEKSSTLGDLKSLSKKGQKNSTSSNASALFSINPKIFSFVFLFLHLSGLWTTFILLMNIWNCGMKIMTRILGMNKGTVVQRLSTVMYEFIFDAIRDWNVMIT